MNSSESVYLFSYSKGLERIVISFKYSTPALAFSPDFGNFLLGCPTMNCAIFILVFTLFQEVPFKPTSEFEVKIDYEFKSRPAHDPNTVQLGSVSRNVAQTSSAVLPYLELHINFLVLLEEKTRMQITTNLDSRGTTKRVSVDSPYVLDLGFTVDMVDRVHAHEYTLTFLDADKNPINRILISIGEDGSFFVNGEKRGLF